MVLKSNIHPPTIIINYVCDANSRGVVDPCGVTKKILCRKIATGESAVRASLPVKRTRTRLPATFTADLRPERRAARRVTHPSNSERSHW